MRSSPLLSQTNASPLSPCQRHCQQKIVAPQQLAQWRSRLRTRGETLVTLNGSFDLMHAGHLHILYEASLQADILLVALNSDASIRQYKSPDRPIIGLFDRLAMLAAIEFVDFLTWFEETDPRELLRLLQPDVHVNGAEYGKNCIEAEVVRQGGGRLHLVNRVPGLATSEIIAKIVRSSCGSSALSKT
jgi:rfaE bifunctional protein nucleotidyltransferase chain/domain